MRVSGPISAIKCEYKGRIFLLMGDRHHSTEGTCGIDCKDIKNGIVSGSGNCFTLSYFLHEKLVRGCDFYLEASFVVKDSQRQKTTPTDNIDIILERFDTSFLRKKNGVYPNSQCHYCDIRDSFIGTYDEMGNRFMAGSNPLTGSYIAKYLMVDVMRYDECDQMISFLLTNMSNYFQYFTEGTELPIPRFDTNLSRELMNRINRMDGLTSMYKGKKMHRVQKQLEKLHSQEKHKVLSWAKKCFDDELKISLGIYKLWKAGMMIALTGDENEHRKMCSAPIACFVALSSLIMDVYLIARALYHDNNREVLIYTGAAHTENYKKFFYMYGSVVEQLGNVDGLERCVRI